MKKSDLRRIIREEVVSMIRGQYTINEAFADPEIAKLSKMRGIRGSRWQNFFRSFAKTHDIAWDKLPKGTLTKSNNVTNDPKIKDGLVFWMIDQEKPNPYSNDRFWDSSRTLYPGVLAVTLNGAIQYMSDGGVGSKGSRRGRSSAGDAVGTAGRGMLMIKKLKEMADHILTMDFESFRGGTTALKAKRAELKLGKDTFTDHRAWKRANMARYKEIMDARVGSRDQVDRMVGEIVKIANEAVKEGMEIVKVGKYDYLMTTVGGNEVTMNSVTGGMTSALRMYAEYIRYANQAEKDKKNDWGGDYNDRHAKDTAGRIKKIHNAFKTGNANEINRY
tara:strand:+ start:915 stop:1913 length:999 start_codon:yes stop_codon:yes gene_type:complete